MCILGGVGAASAIAGCVGAVQDFVAEAGEFVDDDSSGMVRRGDAETFRVEAEEGDEIVTEVESVEEGSRDVIIFVRDPEGNELKRADVQPRGFPTDQFFVDAPVDGTYEVHVDPRGDRDTELRVSVWIA